MEPTRVEYLCKDKAVCSSIKEKVTDKVKRTSFLCWMIDYGRKKFQGTSQRS